MKFSGLTEALEQAGLVVAIRDLPLDSSAVIFDAKSIFRCWTDSGIIVWLSDIASGELCSATDETLLQLLGSQETSDRQPVLFATSAEGVEVDLSSYSAVWRVTAKSRFDLLAKRARVDQALKTILLETFTLVDLSPYQTEHHTPDSMFFGRKDYIAKIMGHPDKSFALLGPRRAGKSSLAKQVERQLRKLASTRTDRTAGVQPGRVAYVDCNQLADLDDPEDDFFQQALTSLGLATRDTLYNRHLFGRRHRDLNPFQFFSKLLRTRYPKVTLIIDEADSVVEARPKGPWPLFRRVQGLLDGLSLGDGSRHDSGNRPRILIAGFQPLQRALQNPNFPLYRRVEELRPGNLGRRPARQLVLEPMRELRVRFLNEADVIRRILLHSGGMPSVVQELCHELLVLLDSTKAKSVSAKLVEDVVRSQKPLSKYTSYFDNIASEAEQLLVRFAAPRKGFRKTSFLEDLRSLAIVPPNDQDLSRLLENLSFANIFTQVVYGKDYAFAVEAFRELICQRIPQLEDEGIALKNVRSWR